MCTKYVLIKSMETFKFKPDGSESVILSRINYDFINARWIINKKIILRQFT